VLPIPAAIVAAVEDALAPFAIRIRQFPVRPRDLAAMLAGAGAETPPPRLYLKSQSA
jgi:hypothetical protein